MMGLPLAFAAPAVLAALVALPIIWWLLRLTPPRPRPLLAGGDISTSRRSSAIGFGLSSTCRRSTTSL